MPDAPLPSVDDILGPAKAAQPQQGGLPSVDEILGPPKETAGEVWRSAAGGDMPMSGPVMDAYVNHGPTKDVLDSFAQGLKQGWGSEPLGIGKETEDFLRKSGVFNDYQSGRTSFLKSFNEALIRPAAVALTGAWRGLGALSTGAAEAIQEAGAQTKGTAVGEALNLPKLASEVAAVAHGEVLIPELAPQIAERAALSPRDLAEARELNVVGGTHAQWEGTAEPTPPEPHTVAEAIKARVEAAGAGTPHEAPAALPEAAPAPPPDIHAVARQIAPDTFRQYDALAQRREVFNRWIDELGQQRTEKPEAVAAKAKVDEILGKVGGVEGKLTKAAAGRLADARAELERLTTTDTADMARVRQDLQKTDYAMRDLAEPVSAAYREAQARVGEGQGAPEGAAPQVREETSARADEGQPATPAAGTQEMPPVAGEAAPVSPAEPGAALEPPAPAAPRVIPPEVAEHDRASITSDVAQKLIAAGRPEEEANAAAALVAAHYDARAQRFGGALGTAGELYAAEAPEIRAGQERARTREYAQGPSGKFRVATDNARATITLFKNADASTFIHETGHSWLEELMSDAQHEAAPPDLKADAQAVREYLNAPAGNIPTRAHEKFARAFENYMREGRAPSTALANVFAQFKEWLTQIYQTVAKLRAPINDDIRGVFDRLLAAPGEERAVIAPDREREPTLADRHADIADRAHEMTPAEAGTAADQIRAEADSLAAQHPEIANELGIQPRAGDETAHPAPDRDVDAGQPVPGGAGHGEEPGGLGASGIEAAAAGSGGKPVATEQPVGPNQPFGEPTESHFVDKAGNIRLDNLGQSEDVNAAIRAAADVHGGFIEARRGVMSDADVLDLADALGMNASDLDKRKIGQAFNAEQIMAARKLLVQSATAVRDAARLVEGGGDDAVMAFGEAVTRHRMIQEQVAGITAEAGRALRAFRAIGGMAEAKELGAMVKDMTGRTLYQMRQQAQAISSLGPNGTPGQVSGMVNAMSKPGVGAMALEVFTNWLISGPITHATYAIGNTGLALWKAIPETAAQATIGALRGGPGRVRFGEIPAQLYAMIRGQRDGWKAAWDSLKAGQTMALPHEALDSLTKPQRAKFDALVANGATFDQAMNHLGIQAQTTTPFTSTQAIPGIAGKIVRAPGERMVAPVHSYFRTIGYAQGIAREAWRAAADEGLAGSAFFTRVAQLTRDPTEVMMEAARGEATTQTLMGHGGELTSRVTALVNWETNLPGLGPTRPLKFIDPFVHVASNIMEQAAIARTPAGLLAGKVRADMSGVNGRLAQDTAIARMAVGTSLGIVVGGLALEGLVTPSAPSDPHEAAMWRLVNGAPHSARIGDTTVELNRLGVLGMMVGIWADLAHAARMGYEGEDLAKVGHYVAHSFVQNFMDEGFMKGPSDLVKAIDEPGRFGKQYVYNFLTSLAVPFSVGSSQVARQIDPYAREARTLMDQIKAKIPWMSEDLMPRRDLWGEPVANRGFAGVYTDRVHTDVATRELFALGERTGYFPAKLKHDIRGVDLSDQQYDDYARIAGRMAKAQVDRIVSLPQYGMLPDGVKVDLIRSAVTGSRESAAALVMMKNPAIIQAAVQAKKAQIETGKHQTHIEQAETR